MIDKRELILSRLYDILALTEGVVEVVRNRGELPADKRPAILLLDGDEESQERARDRGRIGRSPNLVTLRPEVYVALDPAKPHNLVTGQRLNEFRGMILAAVLTDATLQDLVGTNGEVFYAGCITDLARGRSMEGEMGLVFAFTYVLNVVDFA
jgi:hypothetical protein